MKSELICFPLCLCVSVVDWLIAQDSTIRPGAYRRRLLAFSHAATQYPHFFSEYTLAPGIGLCCPHTTVIGTGGNQRTVHSTAKLPGKGMCRHADRQCVMLPAQPARAGRPGGHQVSDGLRTIGLQLVLLRQRERLDVARYLPVTRSDENQPLFLRALLELEDALHRTAIARVAAQAVAGLGRVGDEAAVLEVGGNRAAESLYSLHGSYRKKPSSNTCGRSLSPNTL